MSTTADDDRRSDTALIGEALSGEASALHHLVRRLTPVIQARVARCLLRGASAHRDLRSDVEDYTQDLLLYLFTGSGKPLRDWQAEGGLSLENFVGLVAERRTVSALRSGRRNPWREAPAPAEALVRQDTTPGPEAQATGGDLLARLLERLREALSPLGYRLFELIYVREASVEEVCAETGLSAEAVYAWRSRLRRSARQAHAQLVSEDEAAMRTPSRGIP